MATLEQERAAFALKCVEALAEPGSVHNTAKYKTQLLKLPARLHNNGLGQTAAYLLAQKKGSAEQEIYSWLEQWLRREDHQIYPADQKLIDCISGRAQGLEPENVELRYRRASAEARALSVWFKRFAEAFLEGDAE